MAPHTITPGLHALDPYTPIGHTSFGPIFLAGGGRAGSRGVDILVGDEDDPDPFDEDDDDEGDEDDDDPDDRAAERQRAEDRAAAARGWQKPKSRAKRHREESDEDDRDDLDEDGDEPEARDDRRRGRGKRGSAEDTDEWMPPSREQWERVTDAVKRNNDENFKRRYVAKAMKKLGIEDEDGFRSFMLDRGLDPDSGERIGGDDETSEGEGDLLDSPSGDAAPTTKQRSRTEVIAERRRYEERGRTQAERQYKPGMALFAAEAELRAAGFSGKDISLAIRLIDPDELEIDFDERGWPVVHGLTEQVATIKEGVPEWFRLPRPPREHDEDVDERPARRPASRRRVGGVREVDGGERRRPAEKPMTWLQRADAQMMGRRL